MGRRGEEVGRRRTARVIDFLCSKKVCDAISGTDSGIF